MIEHPLITTIIPTYRRPLALKRALQSVLAQTYHHFKVCVYDNASYDETASIVAEFIKQDSRVQYHCHSQNIDAAPNFEFGMHQVSTPFFSFLSDDDILLPEFYEIALAGFKQYPEAAFSAGSVIDMTDKGRFLAISKITLHQMEKKDPPEGLFQMITNYINWTGILFRREILDVLKGLDTSIKPIDFDFVLKAAAQFSYVVSSHPVAIFIHHSSSYSSNTGLKLVWPSWKKIMCSINSHETLSILDKEKAAILMKDKLCDLLTYIVKQDFLHKNLDNLLSIADLLRELPQGVVRGKILKFIAKSCKKNVILHLVIFTFADCSYKLYEYLRKFRGRKRYGCYSKWLKEKSLPGQT